jgi:hypothetical protein
MEREKRTAKRISYICEVECIGEDIPCLKTRLNDMSTSGVFIDSMICFAVGSVLRLKFSINDVLIETTGEVRYCMPQIGMGVRFIDLSAEHREIIESLVEGRPVTGPLTLPPAAVSNVLAGNFAVVSLFDIIQMIDNSRLTGALLIRLPDVSGEIHFNEGHIAGAVAGELMGMAALNRFLGATEGAFEFKKSSQKFERTIETTNNTALLLDLLPAREEDEVIIRQE